jgi:mono/diheme cytochrome c family protein
MRRLPSLFLLTIALLASAVSPVAAQAPENAPPEGDAGYGARLYRVYCQSCHGALGGGDGPVATELELSIADLRTVTARTDDRRFPAAQVAAIIDGREPVRGHGTRDMPVWSLTFHEPGRTPERPNEIDDRIDALVAYLHSIQTVR